MDDKNVSELHPKDINGLIKLLLTAFHSLQDLVYVVEVTKDLYRYVFVNQAGLKVLNTDESVFGKTFDDVLEEEEAEFLKHQYLKACTSNKIVTFEDQLLLPTGKVMVNETLLTPFIDDDNNIYIIAVVRDITEKAEQLTELQQSRKQLEENGQLLASLMDQNEDAIFIFDKEGFFLEVNGAAEKITGYGNGELIGTHFSHSMPKGEVEKVENLFKQSVAGKSSRHETIIYHKDGHEVYVNIKNIPIVVEGKVTGVFGIARDITKDKKNLEELSVVKSRLESFINDSSDSISMVDRNGKVLFINDAFTNIYGFSKEDVIGNEPPIIPNWLKKQTDDLIQQVLLGEKVHGIHVKRQKKSGELIDMSSSLSPIFDQTGEITGVSHISRDISDQKKLQTELISIKEELELVWNNTSDAIFMIDQNGDFLKGNPAFEEMLGWKVEEMTKLTTSPIYPEFHLKQVEYFLEDLRSGQRIPSFQTQRKRKDGSLIDVVANYRPVNKGNILAVGTYQDVTEYTQVLKKQEESEEKFKSVVEAAPEAIVILIDEKISFINQAGLELLKAKNKAQVIGKLFLDFVYPSDREKLVKKMKPANYQENKRAMGEERFYTLGGDTIYAETTSAFIKDHGNTSVVVMLRDITTKRRAEKAMRESEERFRIIAEHSMDIIKVLDPKGKILYSSPSLEKVLGYPVRKMIGKEFFSNVHPEDLEEIKKKFKKMFDTKAYFQVNLRRIHQDGHSVWLNTDFIPVINAEGEIERVVAISADITEMRRKEKKLSEMAYYDHLTGLPNRRLFLDRLQQAFYTSERTCKFTALMVLDCDKFKNINDTLGHDVGDEVIKIFAKRVKSSLRKRDTLSRVGGDEFTIVLPEISKVEDVVEISERILEIVNEKMLISGNELEISTSIGISFYDPDAPCNVEELFKQADQELYKVKEKGGNSFSYTYESI
ncbi:PAS domain S-box protein [Niallia sp.]|uniref:PAS domain S-box protein n=1 Tax=Niallia sp. TaxID=2837523 RepID=UPI00289F87BD|nr:PAS domain S-box protein [Niallia sp.]